MGDIPKSRDAKHPILRQLLTPFYRTRMRRLQRAHETTNENMSKVRANRAAANDVKALRKAGILK
jgi:hypothetical protein